MRTGALQDSCRRLSLSALLKTAIWTNNWWVQCNTVKHWGKRFNKPLIQTLNLQTQKMIQNQQNFTFSDNLLYLNRSYDNLELTMCIKETRNCEFRIGVCYLFYLCKPLLKIPTWINYISTETCFL